MIHKNRAIIGIIFSMILQNTIIGQGVSVVPCIGAGATLAHISINPILNANILRNAAWVNKKVHQRTMIRRGTYIAVAGIMTYQVLSMYQHFFGTSEHTVDGSVCTKAHVEDVCTVDPNLGWKDWIGKKATFVKEWISSGKTWVSIGSFGAQLLSEMVAVQVIDSFRQSVMTEESIGWFVLEHAPFMRTIDLLKVSGYDLERPVDDTNKEHMLSVFISDMNQFVNHIEKILGYMHYRYLTYLKEQKTDVTRQGYEIIILLKEQTDQFIQKVDAMLAADTFDGLLRLITSYEFILEQHCERFADREQSRWIDVRRIQKMIDDARSQGICLCLPQ